MVSAMPSEQSAVKENAKKAKMIIVMRNDLNMRKGKIAAQSGHAVLLAYKVADHTDEAFRSWDLGQFTKICVRADSEQQLLEIVEKAKANFLNVALITDAGHTEFHGVPTHTCCAIGPAWAEDLEPITGGLTLL